MGNIFGPLGQALKKGLSLFKSPVGFARFCFFAILLISPFFVLPITGSGVAASQILVSTILLTLSFIVLVFSTLQRGYIRVPQTPVIGGVFLFTVAMLLSTLFSRSKMMNLVGYGSETTSFIFIYTVILIFLLAITSTQNTHNARRVIRGVSFIGVLFLVWQTLLIIFPAQFNFKVLPTITSSLFGSLFDLSVLFGLLLVWMGITLEFRRSISKTTRILYFIGFIVANIFLIVSSFTALWIIIGLLSIGLCLYFFAFNSGSSRKLPVYFTAMALIAVLGISFGPSLQSFVGKYRQVAYLEVNGSAVATAKTFVKATIKNPITGTGSNTFSALFPQNNLVPENRFNIKTVRSGFGYFGTVGSVTGILGLLATLYLVVMILRFALKAGFGSKSQDRDRVWFYKTALSLGVLYFTVILLFRSPGSLILYFFAAILGALIGLCVSDGSLKVGQLALLGSKKKNILMVVIGFVLMLGAFYLTYLSVRGYVSTIRFASGLQTISQGQTEQGILTIESAQKIAHTDTTSRVLTNIAMSRIDEAAQKLSKTTDKNEQTAILNQVKQFSTAAEFYALQAKDYNQYYFGNWQFLGDLYRRLTVYGFSGAADRAREFYDAAKVRNPLDPTMILNDAALEFAKGNQSKAKDQVVKTVKDTPTKSAYLFLYELALTNNDQNEAIRMLEKVIEIDSLDPNVLYNLGNLYFRAGEYDKAETVLERSISIDRSVLEPYLLLGLTYEKNGKSKEADQVYAFLKSRLPTAEEIISAVRKSFNQTTTTTDSTVKK